MKGYTIQNSIELLEKKAGSGSGGASTAAEVSFDNTGTGLVATNVQTAVSEVNSNVGELSGRFDYSTNEKAIGKWLDGTTLYEKTFTGTTASDTTATKIADTGSDTVIRAFSGLVGGVREINSYLDNLSNSVTWISSLNANELYNIATGAIFQSKDYYVTVHYTKPAPVTNTRSKKSKKEE